jgi:hypothetical protein
MDYWAETIQDDCYLIAADGWKAETYRIIEKGKERDKGWSCDLRKTLGRARPDMIMPVPDTLTGTREDYPNEEYNCPYAV